MCANKIGDWTFNLKPILLSTHFLSTFILQTIRVQFTSVCFSIYSLFYIYTLLRPLYARNLLKL